jgi:molybdate/tungstate transport system permease protein
MKKKLDLTVFFITLLALTLFILPSLSLLFSTNPVKILKALGDPEFQEALKVSFLCAFASSFLILIVGLPFSYFLARKKIPLSKTLEILSEIPTAIPHSVAGIAVLYLFGNSTFIGRFLNFLHLGVYGSYLGIILAMTFVSAPYFIATVREGIWQLPVEYEKISYTLGRGKIYTFFKVVIPMVKSHILKGFILSWGRAVSEFGAVMVVAYFPMTATVYIYEKLETMGISVTLPYATLMLLLTGGIFVFLRILWGKYAEGRKSAG